MYWRSRVATQPALCWPISQVGFKINGKNSWLRGKVFDYFEFVIYGTYMYLIWYGTVWYIYVKTINRRTTVIFYYRHPCVATEPIMFCFCLFIFIFIFYSPFVLRNYPTDFHQIFRNCVFWCSLNNSIVLKFFWRHLAEKNAKNSKNLLKISRVDSDFWQ